MPLRLRQQLEGVSRRPRSPSEDTDHKRGVVIDEFLQLVRPVESHLEKQWPFGARQAGKGPHDAVVDEGAHVLPGQADGRVRVEDLEDVTQPGGAGIGTETCVGLQGRQVQIAVVVEGDGVQHEVAKCTDQLQVGRPERSRRPLRVTATALIPDVGGIVGPHHRRNGEPSSTRSRAICSPLDAEVSMLSTVSSRTRAVIASKYSWRERRRGGVWPGAMPAAATPKAMSASLASAMMKSSGLYPPAKIVGSLRGRGVFCLLFFFL